MEHDEDIPGLVQRTASSVAGGSSTAGRVGAAAESPLVQEATVGDAAPGASESAVGAFDASSDPSQSASEDVEVSRKRGRAKGPAGGAREASAAKDEEPAGGKEPKGKRHPNNVRRLRIERMMSKAELARRANLSVLTIDRVEKGYGCRMDSKRKILEALGLSLADRARVFGEEE
jgi:DNA-binding XRE family transcriptional regulator